MLQDLTDYAKCAIANKYTFTGYASTILAVGLEYSSLPQNGLLNATQIGLLGLSSIMLGISVLGYESFRVYKLTKKYIDKHMTINHRLRNLAPKAYCIKIGIKLAARESGLEHLLQV